MGIVVCVDFLRFSYRILLCKTYHQRRCWQSAALFWKQGLANSTEARRNALWPQSNYKPGLVYKPLEENPSLNNVKHSTSYFATMMTTFCMENKQGLQKKSLRLGVLSCKAKIGLRHHKILFSHWKHTILSPLVILKPQKLEETAKTLFPVFNTKGSISAFLLDIPHTINEGMAQRNNFKFSNYPGGTVTTTRTRFSDQPKRCSQKPMLQFCIHSMISNTNEWKWLFITFLCTDVKQLAEYQWRWAYNRSEMMESFRREGIVKKMKQKNAIKCLITRPGGAALVIWRRLLVPEVTTEDSVTMPWVPLTTEWSGNILPSMDLIELHYSAPSKETSLTTV